MQRSSSPSHLTRLEQSHQTRMLLRERGRKEIGREREMQNKVREDQGVFVTVPIVF
uniref:Uncharacterized protein n=1 Tax=Nelumbo nucifera TaxID=4432 RepID=A0A822XKL5_NELNU|nr:TPA_asm: hypothetical protein HUJ06_021716 [Nelumbo nucifera]